MVLLEIIVFRALGSSIGLMKFISGSSLGK